MIAPVRLQLRRTARFNLQAASLAINGLPARSCARPTLMGNPFGWQTPQLTEHGGRRLAVRQHRVWLIDAIVPRTEWKRRAELLELRDRVLAGLPEYRAHNLGCWCGLDQLCHVDTVLECANK